MQINLPNGDSLDSRTICGVRRFTSKPSTGVGTYALPAIPDTVQLERTTGHVLSFYCPSLAAAQMWQALLNAAWQRRVTV